jgi:predicted patatin/cPLA2 family phospholipase
LAEHKPLPKELYARATIPGIADARCWGDEAPPWTQSWFDTPKKELQARYPGIVGVKHNYLAISGGGANGAFGAGFLAGWTQKRTRPEFTAVTGISTGALIAPFAYLGSAYDATIEELYTCYATKDLVKQRSPLAAVTSSAMFTTQGLKAAIAKYFDRRVLEAIAAEWTSKGRPLSIGTTNLYALRPVIWRLATIAASGAPNALALARKILLASTSLPMAFPPVHIQVEVAGTPYKEMHVDGGAAAQLFLYPTAIDWRRVLKKLDVKGSPNIYIIRNSRLEPDWEPVKARVLPIAMRTLSSLVRTQGIGDIFRVYLSAQRDGLNFNLIHIPDDFDLQPKERFDPVYMRELFQLGHSLGRSKNPWKPAPPGF